MKKLTTLVLAAGLVVSSFAGASAGEFKPSATLINQYEYATGGSALVQRAGEANFGHTDNFMASLRMDLGFDYIASENLSATFLMRFQENYGALNQGNGAMFDSSMQGTLGVRLAYLDWMIPSTDVSVRLGYQPAVMPSFAFGSAVLDTRGGGVTISAPINENVSVAAVWIRALGDDSDNNKYYLPGHANFVAGQGYGHDDADVFALVADFNYDGFRIAPWAMYAMAGSRSQFPASGVPLNDATGALDAFWIGASFELSMFDPFKFALDAYYNDYSLDHEPRAIDDLGSAYFVGGAISYATEWGTPALRTWYASGNDQSGGHNDFTAPIVLSGAFAATSIMFDDQVLDNGLSNITAGSPAGTWGVVLEWADFSFVEKLSHTARVAYIGGTNGLQSHANASLDNLGWDDSVIEVNFNSTYEIYKNLSTSLELGYLAADFDHDFNDDQDDDIFRSALSFTYSF